MTGLTGPTADFATPTIEIAGIPDFWDRVRAAERLALFLDYDGTLAPFHVDRMAAVPLPGVREAIAAIASAPDTLVAIVSGRPVSEVHTLLGNLGIIVVGSHGYEIHDPSGRRIVARTSEEQQAILDAAYAEALRTFDPARVERKVASVAVHVRGLDPRESGARLEELERRWRAAARADLAEFRPFNGGIELRAAGRTKGTAIRELLALEPPSTLVVYIGDDDTDEDAFAELDDRGIGIKVGPMNAVTRAKGRVPDVEAVRSLLLRWREERQGAR